MAAKGHAVPGDLPCCHCGARSALRFTGRFVTRGLIEPSQGESVEFRRVSIPLARCSSCRRGMRVLPAHVLPHKTFTLPAIEIGVTRYLAPDGPGLRRVVDGMGRWAPDHASLHRWLGGLGDRSLDRLHPPFAQTALLTTASLVVATEQSLRVEVRALWHRSASVSPLKYRSETRRDQLQSCARLLATAAGVFPDSSRPLTAWNLHLVEILGVTCWSFPTGSLNTAMQHTAPSVARVGSRSTSTPRRRASRYAARSPPRRRVPPRTDHGTPRRGPDSR